MDYVYINEEGVWYSRSGSFWELVAAPIERVPDTTTMTFDEFLTKSAEIIEGHQRRQE